MREYLFKKRRGTFEESIWSLVYLNEACEQESNNVA